MSRHLCGHCGTLTSTTACPNDVEGWFVDDDTLESHSLHYRIYDGVLLDWLREHGARAADCAPSSRPLWPKEE